MPRHLPPLLLLCAIFAGCASVSMTSRRVQPDDAPRPLLQPGDVLVSVSRGTSGKHHELQRIRPVRSRDGDVRTLAEQLMELPSAALRIAASADGRWLAVELDPSGAGSEIRLWDLSEHRTLDVEAPAWIGPLGCAWPTFDPRSEHLLIGCPEQGRQPASILRVRLSSDARFRLVGERDRVLPSVGVDGDYYWIEQRGELQALLRRSRDRLPYVTHELPDRVLQIWHQLDGDQIAQIELPGGRRQLVRLLSSGAVRSWNLPPNVLMSGDPEGQPLQFSASGAFVIGTCKRGGCALQLVDSNGLLWHELPLAGEAEALALVSGLRRELDHGEDLATAPSHVLREFSAPKLSLLGIRLGMGKDEAFSVLARASRRPLWIVEEGHGEPRGIGLGRPAEGHCVEFLFDERGSVRAIELQLCAAPYLSPALRSLFDRELLVEEPRALVHSYLGGRAILETPGADDDTVGRWTGLLPVERRRIRFDAPERGLRFEVETERPVDDRLQFLDAKLRFRLSQPGRGQAARPVERP